MNRISNHSRKWLRSARRGFTLVEIMVVVIIIGVVSAVAVPNMSGAFETVRLRTASQQVIALMDYCYQSATASGRVHGLMMQPEGGTIEVVREFVNDPYSPDFEEYDPFLESGVLEPIALPGSMNNVLPEGVIVTMAETFDESMVGLDDNEIRILFFPDGTSEFLRITLMTETQTSSRIIELNGLTSTAMAIDPLDIENQLVEFSYGENLDDQ